MKPNDRAMSSDDIKATLRAAELDQALWFSRIHDAYEAYRSVDMTSEWLADYRTLRSKRLFSHIKEAVPAYRGVDFDSDADLDELLLSFAPVSKTVLRDNFVDHCSDDIDPTNCRLISTSGTTGEPFNFVRTRDQMVDGHALGWVRDVRWKIPFGSRVIRPNQDWLPDWFEHTVPAERLARVVQFGDVEDPRLRFEFARRSREFAPHVVIGHPSYLRKFASLLAEGGQTLDDAIAIFTFGENLTAGIRQELEAGLGAPLYDIYGLKEFGAVAAQFPECGNYHITDESLYVEILDSSGSRLPDGEVGEITITDFTNFAMPFVRYRTGDTGSLRAPACTCGAPHRVLDLIDGRSAGEFALPGGERSSIGRLTRVARGYSVRSFQFVARSGGRIELNLEALPGLRGDDVRDLERRITDMLRGSASVAVRIVDRSEFAVSPSGKVVDFVDMTEGDIASRQA
ncbi:phenylacetate--CoA ligase family protein [Nocardia abscessus]|uniref:phenylacetate--CoA ligase family protein n=1 Tax=Nocardia abscessus TaxID=120957 RepID=UPI0024574852|nr:AMP-binding protein [Nocardia abscessus]